MNAEHIKLIAAATNNEIASMEEWMVDAVETQDSIEAFRDASARYAESTMAKFGSIAGFKFIAFSRVQLRKGDPRLMLSVIDFGDYRVALDTDLSVF